MTRDMVFDAASLWRRLRKIPVGRSKANRQDKRIDLVSFDQRHISYTSDRVENDRVSFTPKGNIFIRSDEDERNALYSIFQPLRDFDRLLVFRYIFVAENIDFHLVPF